MTLLTLSNAECAQGIGIIFLCVIILFIAVTYIINLLIKKDKPYDGNKLYKTKYYNEKK